MAATDGPSRIAELSQTGLSRLLFPRKGDRVEATLVNIAGGITGGDRFEVDATVGAGGHLTLTTQSCERIYRAQPGQPGRLTTSLRVQKGGRLNWLPQETILFDGTHYQRRLDVDLVTDARFLGVEAVLFGRHHRGERLSSCRFRDQINIRRDGKPLVAEAMALDGDVTAKLAKPFIAGGAAALATLLYVAPDAEAKRETLRRSDGLAPTLICDDVLIVRCLAAEGFALRQVLLPALTILSDVPLPTVWSL